MTGGVVRAASIRSVQRASSRSCAPVSCAVRDGETSRSARASAASVERPAPAPRRPREGDDPVPRVGRAMDGQAAAALAVVDPQPADPGDDRGDRDPASRGPGRARRAGRARGARIALAVPGPAPADGDLELDHRLEPVDVRALEQADLDQSHGPGRIASRGTAARLRPDDGRRPSRRIARPDRRARRPARADRRRPAGLPRRPRAPGQHRLRQLHARRRRRGRPLGGRRSWPSSARRRAPARPGGPARRHGRRRRSTGRPAAPRALLIGHMDTVFDPGPRPSGRSGSTTASPTARASPT